MDNLSKSHQSTVLYVDDEENNLNSFRAAFRREFRIFTAKNAVDALKLLKKHPEIKVIIAMGALKIVFARVTILSNRSSAGV